MRRYELMLLLRPDLDDEKLQGAVEKVTRAIVNGGGSLSKVSPWGKRRLAYDINHFREASYFLIHFDIEPAAVREIERGLLISEEILRHLVTVIEERPTAEVPPEAVAGTDEVVGEEGDEEAETATEAAAEPEESSASSDGPEGEGGTEEGDAEEQEAAATEG
jgi:small subunit ribosomal protein S6